MTHLSRSTAPGFVHSLTRVLSVPGQRVSQTRSAPVLLCRAKATTPAPVGKPLPATNFRLAPSDFAFLWEECKRCFYLKAHKKLYRPRAPFPSIFGSIDLAMKRHFRGIRTTDVFPGMKPGTFLCEDDDAWVECLPITPPGHSDSAYIRGMIDCLIRFDDGTYGIVDFKTSSAARSALTYSRQLHAYAQALENPSVNSELIRGDVSEMALVIYTPNSFHTPIDEQDGGKLKAALAGDITYLKVQRDDKGFMSFLGEVLDVLTLEEAPEAPKMRRRSAQKSCPYCQYLQAAKSTGFIPK